LLPRGLVCRTCATLARLNHSGKYYALQQLRFSFVAPFSAARQETEKAQLGLPIGMRWGGCANS